jgi:multicomponent Na+:H+ antiporter subunit D
MTVIALPILLPLLFIIVLLVVRSVNYAKWISLFGSVAIFSVSVYLLRLVSAKGIQVLQLGGWSAPYGISLVIDTFSALMLLISAILAVVISLYSFSFIQSGSLHSKFYIFFFSLLMGVNGAFITGDVFNLYVWFEVMLMSSFVLITLGKSKAQLEGGIKYLALNLIGSLFFLAGLGLLYGKTGTLNMAHLAEILKNDDQAILMNTSAVLFFVAFGIKAAVFPLYFWLPASYHTPNITITALFAGLLTKVGVYTLIRFFTLFFVQDQQFWHQLLFIIAGLTMVSGGIAAAAHYETRRILSYHIISQIGYMIMGLGIFTPLALAGAIFFIMHNMIAKTNTFLISGVINKIKGTYYLKDIGGLFKQSPFLAVLFIIPAFALAGFPPLSGFFAKFILIKAGYEAGDYLITTVALLTGMLTIYSMVKIWNEAFLKKQPEQENVTINLKKPSLTDIAPSIILGSLTILMGLFAGKVFDFCMRAANELIDSSNYIDAVLK